MASLDQFLQTGRLGPVNPPLSKEDVRRLLGEPDSISVQKSPEIWKYGSLQLGFFKFPDLETPLLLSITLYFHDPEVRLPQLLAPEGWFPGRDTSYEEFRAHLDEVGIPVFGGVAAGPSQHLVLPSTVRVTFEEGRLYSVGFTAKSEIKKGKQITIFISGEFFEALRRKAVDEGVSVSLLCSRRLEEWAAELQHH